MTARSGISGDPSGSSGPILPVVPSERSAWLGLAATLLACLIACLIYFWLDRVQGI